MTELNPKGIGGLKMTAAPECYNNQYQCPCPAKSQHCVGLVVAETNTHQAVIGNNLEKRWIEKADDT